MALKPNFVGNINSEHFNLFYCVCVSNAEENFHCTFRETAKYFSDRGMQLVVWTVNHPAEKKYLSECVNVPYITDTLIQHTDL